MKNTLYISISTFIDDVDTYMQLIQRTLMNSDVFRFHNNIHAYEYVYVCMYVHAVIQIHIVIHTVCM